MMKLYWQAGAAEGEENKLDKKSAEKGRRRSRIAKMQVAREPACLYCFHRTNEQLRPWTRPLATDAARQLRQGI